MGKEKLKENQQTKLAKFIKSASGVTLMALVMTIILIIILASITLVYLTGDNAIVNNSFEAKEMADIDSEQEVVSLSASEVMEVNEYGNLDQESLQKSVDSNIGDKHAVVSKEGKIYLVKFTETNRVYKVLGNGTVEYVGRQDEVQDSGVLTIDPNGSSVAKKNHKVNIIVNTFEDKQSGDIKIEYSL